MIWVLFVGVAAGVVVLWGSVISVAAPRAATRSSTTDQADPPPYIRVLFLLGMVSISALVVRAGGLTLSDLCFFGALVGVAGWLVSTGRPIPGLPPIILVPIGVFTLGGLVSAFAASSGTDAIGAIVRFAYVTLVWFWLARAALPSVDRVHEATFAWVLSLALAGAVAVLQSATGTAIVPGALVEYGRVSGLTGHVNDLGGAAAIAVVPACYLASAMRGAAGWVARGAVLLVGAALLFSGSNGAAIGAVAGVLVWLIWARPFRFEVVLRFAAIGLVAWAIVVAAGISPPNPLDRFRQATSENVQTDTLRTRTEVADVATRAIEANPFNGVGLGYENGSTGAETTTGDYVHNLFIAAWYQAGILGYVGIVLTVLALATIAKRAAALKDRSELAIALACAVIAFLVVSLSSPLLFQRYGWVAPALLFALWQARGRRPPSSIETTEAGSATDTGSPTKSRLEPVRHSVSRVAWTPPAQREVVPPPVLPAYAPSHLVDAPARRSERKRRLRLDGAIAGTLGAALGGQFALLVTGVVSARLLGVEDRGHLALFALVPVLLSQLGGLGLPLAVTFEVARDGTSPTAVFRTIRATVIAQTAVVTALQAGLFLAIFFNAEHSVLVAAAVSIPTAAAMLVQLYALAFLQGTKHFGAFNLWRSMPAVSYAGGAIVLALLQSHSLVVLTLVWTATAILSAAATIAVAVAKLRGRTGDTVHLGTMLRFGLKGLLGSASPLETYRPDQAIVGFLLSPASLGLYVTAVAVTNLPRFIASSIGMVAYPTIAAARGMRREALRSTAAFGLRCAALTAPIVIALELLSEDLVRLLFGPSFVPATDTCRILLIAAFLLGLRRVLSDGLRGVGLAGVGSVAEVLSWLVFVPSAALLASLHGLTGVAWAVVLAATVSFVVVVGSLATQLVRAPRPDGSSPD